MKAFPFLFGSKVSGFITFVDYLEVRLDKARELFCIQTPLMVGAVLVPCRGLGIPGLLPLQDIAISIVDEFPVLFGLPSCLDFIF